MPDLASLSTMDLAVNAIFMVVGACLSAALALWLDISGTTGRLRARREERLLHQLEPATRTGGGNVGSVAQSPRKTQPRKPRRSEWTTEAWLFVLAIRSLIVGLLLIFLSLGIGPLLDGLQLSELVIALARLAIFMTGLFLISWTWAGSLNALLGLRIILAIALPIALFSSAYFNLAIGSEFFAATGKVLSYAIVALPILSLWARTEMARSLWSRFRWSD